MNVDRIQELHSSFGGEYVVLLHDKTRLTLSRGYREGVQAILGKTSCLERHTLVVRL